MVWLARLALALISSFSKNFGVGQILFGWDKNFLKTFVRGQKFSEIFCPSTKLFIPWDKNFLKIFILGHCFSRTKIPVTGLYRRCICIYVLTVPPDLNFTLASTYSRALTPFHRAVSRCLRVKATCSRVRAACSRVRATCSRA